MVAYHLQIGWAKGGYLGVDLFFVLSGFLITTLLLEEWVGTGRVNLAAFWGRRARRLLPALFLVVAALALYLVCNALFGGPGANGLIDLSGLRGDAIATLLYVNNWHLIFAHQSYFAQFSTPSPLQHTWSLAIEEQFYLVWPLLLLVLLRYGRRSWRRVGVTVTVDPRRGLLGLDGGAVPSRSRPVAHLLRHRHPAVRPHGRCDHRLPGGLAPAAGRTGAPDPPLGGSGGGGGARRVLGVAPARPVACPRTSCSKVGSCSAPRWPRWSWRTRAWSSPGRFARGLAWRPLHFVGTISYGIYLWHWPVIVYLNGARTGLSTWPLNLLRIAVTLAVSTASYYLVERPIRLAKLRGGLRLWVGPVAGVVTAVVIVVATIPAVADPTKVVGTTHLASSGSVQSVPGAGGYAGQQPIRLAPAPSAADPLRVMILGDSVMHDASYGITASLQATGEATVATRTIDGFGLTTATSWPTSIPNLIRQTRAQLIVASWSWDQYGPTTPNALHQPVQYTDLLRRAVATMLAPGQRRRGRDLHPVPPVGRSRRRQPGQHGELQQGAPGRPRRLEQHRREDDVKLFPGRVMYFPLADSILLHGKYSAWLPPEGDPHAPNSAWIRVRKLDNVHLCPEGSARYAAALLADMTSVFRLAPADGNWSQGAWTSDPDFNDPPGACPDDHPPG